MDKDEEMTLGEIHEFIKNLVYEYESLLTKEIWNIETKGGIATYRKIKRIKKHVLFKLLKWETKK